MATQKITMPLRPLNRGIIRNLPPNGLPAGAIYDTDGVIMRQRGIGRRPAFRHLVTIPDIEYLRLLTYYTEGDGSTKIVYITNRGEFWVFDPITGAHVKIEAKFVPEVGQNLSGTVGSFELSLATGDWATTGLATGESITVPGQTFIIAEIISATVVRVTEAVVTTFDTIDWYGAYLIGNGEDEEIDFVQYLNHFIFTDDNIAPLYFDGSTILRIGGAEGLRCRTVIVASDRLYMGNITYLNEIPANHLKSNNKMLIWADIPGNINSMDPTNVYLHIPYVNGSIEKLTFLGNQVMCYFGGGVMIGRRTTVAGSALPYAFDRYETGHRGISNTKAVVSSKDGNFFTSSDNIYAIGGDFSMQPVGSPISEELYDANYDTSKSALLNDPEANYVFLLGSLDGNNYNVVMSFNLETGAWGKFFKNFQQIGLIDYTVASKYKDYDPALTYAEMDPTLIYSDQDVASYSQQLAISDGPSIYVLNPDSIYDHDGPVHFMFETGDSDLDKQDMNKTFHRLSIKMLHTLENVATFQVEGSVDQGITWRDLGATHIAVGQIEGYVNFLMTGPMIRFRVTSDGESKRYIITELAIDVKLKGGQNKNLV